jgi:hypothetical protein
MLRGIEQPIHTPTNHTHQQALPRPVGHQVVR